jgi:uncharacterized protein YozE (UPF0346 family)
MEVIMILEFRDPDEYDMLDGMACESPKQYEEPDYDAWLDRVVASLDEECRRLMETDKGFCYDIFHAIGDEIRPHEDACHDAMSYYVEHQENLYIDMSDVRDVWEIE